MNKEYILNFLYDWIAKIQNDEVSPICLSVSDYGDRITIDFTVTEKTKPYIGET